MLYGIRLLRHIEDGDRLAQPSAEIADFFER